MTNYQKMRTGKGFQMVKLVPNALFLEIPERWEIFFCPTKETLKSP